MSVGDFKKIFRLNDTDAAVLCLARKGRRGDPESVIKTPTVGPFQAKNEGEGIKTVTKKCPSDRPEGRVVVFVVTKLACPPPKKPNQNRVKNAIFRNVGDHFRTSLFNYAITRPN